MRPLFLSFIAFLLVSGCAHYQSGDPAQLPFEKLYIDPAANHSFAPQAQAQVTQQLAQMLLKENQIQVVDREEADAILEITLRDYERRMSTASQADTGRADAFDLILFADLTLSLKDSGKILLNGQTVRADVTVNSGNNNLLPAEYQATPVLARELAQHIRDAITGAW